jgi:hypothetical protein
MGNLPVHPGGFRENHPPVLGRRNQLRTGHKQGKLATMDRAVLPLLAEKRSAGDFVELI